MARIRTVKPEHWSDKGLTQLSLPAHLLWIGTWNFSDDEGVFENDPVLIKSNIFPRRTDVRVEQVSQWLDQIIKARYIIPFVFDNVSYFIHRTFKAHQKIDRPNPSKVPTELIKKVLDDNSTIARRSLSSVEESIGEESKGNGAYRKFAHLEISQSDFHKLIDAGFSKEKIDDIIDRIENYKLNKNYTSLYLTANNWLKSDLKKEKNPAKNFNNGKQSKADSAIDGINDILRSRGRIATNSGDQTSSNATEDQEYKPG
jgi:hypothetical protein